MEVMSDTERVEKGGGGEGVRARLEDVDRWNSEMMSHNQSAGEGKEEIGG